MLCVRPHMLSSQGQPSHRYGRGNGVRKYLLDQLYEQQDHVNGVAHNDYLHGDCVRSVRCHDRDRRRSRVPPDFSGCEEYGSGRA